MQVRGGRYVEAAGLGGPPTLGWNWILEESPPPPSLARPVFFQINPSQVPLLV